MTLQIHRNKQNILYTEVTPAYYIVAIEKPDGWHYGLKIWRWDIDGLFPDHLYALSTAASDTYRDAFEEGIAAYLRVSGGGDHA